MAKKRASGFNAATDVEFPPELDNDTFKAAWADWCADRAERKKPMTKRAAAIALNKCRRWGTETAVHNIERAIEGAWAGLWEDSSGRGNVGNASRVGAEQGKYDGVSIGYAGPNGTLVHAPGTKGRNLPGFE